MTVKVFMVMPFMNEIADSNYEHSIKPICELYKLDIRRADEIFTTSPIYDDIVKEIQDASIIIVDITSKNPNVFYELGMAHTLKQNRTIMVTQDGFKEMPFDIAHFRIIPYENSIAGKVKFERTLKSTIKTLLSDYKESFKDEFELTANIYLSAGKHGDLIGLVGLNSYKGTLNINERVHLEGEYPGGESTNSSVSVKNSFKSMETLLYVKYENEIISLTDKGKAFVQVLIEKGIKCNQFNNQIFVENYKPVMERRVGKNKG